ncbi:MAG TPA: hypothetical protein VJV39_18010 [Dongiaceae bacterium]|nr:hypothetical protein [Dongiaceae bacterium]
MASRTLKKWLDDDFWSHSTSRHQSTSTEALPDPSPNPTLPVFDADNFRPNQRIDNPYFPAIRGTVYTYATLPEEEGDDTEWNNVFATFESKTINGVKALVSRDTAYVNGVLAEDTLDYFAQDKHGNVWYLGELTYAFQYDDDGNFLGTSTEGTWLAGSDGAKPGYIMPTRETLEALGNGYFEEFSPGVAVDQAQLLTFKGTADIDIGSFKGVLETLNTSQLEPDVREIKNYEPGVGMVVAEERTLDGELSVEQLMDIRLLKHGGIGHELFKDHGDPDLKDLINHDIGVDDFEQPELRDFRRPGSEVHVTFLGGDTEFEDALGFYTFDRKTGLIDDVELLFPDTEELKQGDEFVIGLDKGEGYGLFLIPNAGEIGLDLSPFEDGGLEFRNFLTGKQASIYDRMAPQVIGEDGTPLPIATFHALDVNTHDDWNLLNPAGGIQAVERDSDTLENSPRDDKAEVLGFEDMFVSDPEYDGDFDDVVVAVSRTALPANLVADVADDHNLAAAAA